MPGQRAMQTPSDETLKSHLERLYGRYGAGFLTTDPIRFPRACHDPADREVIGFLAAAMAYGRVEQILASVQRLSDLMGPSPAAYVARFDPVRERSRLAGFTHRFNDGRDVGLLFWYLRQMLRAGGSIEGFFLQGYRASHDDVGPALSSFARRALALDCSPYFPSGRLSPRAGVRFFFSDPADGSSCKRLNLFLRWMVRPDDGVDMGLWRRVDPSHLVIPLDTHVWRIASYLGLTRRRSPGWKSALEVTHRLRRLDPDDPIRYDFALCRMGILDACPRRRDPVVCEGCDLKPVCALS